MRLCNLWFAFNALCRRLLNFRSPAGGVCFSPRSHGWKPIASFGARSQAPCPFGCSNMCWLRPGLNPTWDSAKSQMQVIASFALSNVSWTCLNARAEIRNPNFLDWNLIFILSAPGMDHSLHEILYRTGGLRCSRHKAIQSMRSLSFHIEQKWAMCDSLGIHTTQK